MSISLESHDPIWREINNLKEEVYNETWGIKVRAARVEENTIPDIYEKLNNSGWGIWTRIENLEKTAIPELHNKLNNREWGVWARIMKLEEENAQLKDRINRLEQLADNLEKMLTLAVSNQLGINDPQ